MLRALGPEGDLRASLLFMRPPAWIREHAAALVAEQATMLAGFPPPEIMFERIAAILRFDRRADAGLLQLRSWTSSSRAR